jgi:hypothetical protein
MTILKEQGQGRTRTHGKKKGITPEFPCRAERNCLTILTKNSATLDFSSHVGFEVLKEVIMKSFIF